MRIIRNYKFFLAIFVASIIAVIFPFNLTMAPRRDLIIVNSKGTPIPFVRQIWHQYSLNVHGEEDFFIFSNNHVSLPKREVKTNLLSIIIGAFRETRQLLIHASYRSSESIGVFATGYQNAWFYNGKGLDQGKVILVEGDERPRIEFNLGKWLVQECMKLKPGIKLSDLTEKLGLPSLKRKDDQTIWVIFERNLGEAKPILARINPKDGTVLELRCKGEEPSQWILDEK